MLFLDIRCNIYIAPYMFGVFRRGNKPPVLPEEEKTLVYENKTSYDIMVNGLATALLKYQGCFKHTDTANAGKHTFKSVDRKNTPV